MSVPCNADKCQHHMDFSPQSEMAAPAGFEPAYSGETVRSLNRSAKGSSIKIAVWYKIHRCLWSLMKRHFAVPCAFASSLYHCIFFESWKKTCELRSVFFSIIIWCQNTKPSQLAFSFSDFWKIVCSQVFFHDKEESWWYDKATKRKRSEKADGHKGKSRIIPLRVLSSISN